ncbi:hypothetical protein VNO80_06543 [Phaseolus coccineus]|uniref:ATPase AAA-type core domain-containing protein n=1 Tax=Phaseolus coccineus TaxID=3886 RepID=A0AAN9REK8_PHACN
MQKVDRSSPACESSKMNTPTKLTPRKRTSKNSTSKKNSTPKKTPKKSGSVVASSGSAQKIDLRLEAKLSAEIDAKVYAGLRIHPFFSLWKEENERQRALIEAKKKGKGIGGSCHVFENVQDDASPIDWSDWTFLDNTTVAYSRESSNLSFMDGSVESLNLDNIPSASSFSSASIIKNVMSCPSQLSIQPDSMLETSPPNSVVLEKAKYHLKSKDVKVDLGLEVNENTFSVHMGIFKRPDIEPHCKFLQASMRSYYYSSEGNSSLWMHKYKPTKAFEVCGNEEAINFLRYWLHLWHKRLYQYRKSSSNKGQSKRQDDGADSEAIHEDPLQSVLLITGPIGSGKSAAVYACAQEQGFNVLEINASSCRNGAAITAIKNKLEEPSAGKITSCFKPVKSLPADKKMDDWGIASSSIDEARQTLILVEDVGIILPEDRGFITAIQHFSATAKWPIILTSDRNNGGLPNSFARLHVSFSSPLLDELLCHMYKVCIIEEVSINPLLLKKFIQSCDGDIRKTIMQLQFWFQRKKHSEGV